MLDKMTKRFPQAGAWAFGSFASPPESAPMWFFKKRASALELRSLGRSED
jgi:hypothetical protein